MPINPALMRPGRLIVDVTFPMRPALPASADEPVAGPWGRLMPVSDWTTIRPDLEQLAHGARTLATESEAGRGPVRQRRRRARGGD